MTLHDRIMAIEHQIKVRDVVKCTRHPESVICEAAEIAKEADELMSEMAEALNKCRGVDQSESIDADYAYTLYLKYKETTK